MKLKKKKKTSYDPIKPHKRFAIFVVSFFAFVFIRMIIGSIWTDYSGVPEVALVSMGSIQNTKSVRGIIIRDETLVKAPFGGKCELDVLDEQKIPQGRKIATIFKGSPEQLLEQLKSIDLDIIHIQQTKEVDMKPISAELAALDRQISQDIGEIVRQSNSNSMIELPSLKRDIDTLIQKRVLAIESLNVPDSYVNELKAKRVGIRAQIDADTAVIRAQYAGEVSFSIDGYETTLTPASIDKLTVAEVRKIKPKNIKINVENINANTDMCIAKIVKGVDYSIAFCMPSKECESMIEGQQVKFKLTGVDKLIDGVIVFKSGVQSGNNVLVLKTSQELNRVLDKRVVSIDLVINSCKGMKVPLKSLSDIDKAHMTAKLAVIKYGSEKLLDVKILGMDDEFAIIENAETGGRIRVNLYDTFIENVKGGS